MRKKLQNKGIILDDKKKQYFDKYSYYQVVNAYKNIFSTGIEKIDDIEKNIKNSIDIDRYRKNFSISTDTNDGTLYRGILISICQKYGIGYKYADSNDELKDKIKGIKYYNHLYSNKVIYSDFIRIYKFEHELRNVLLKYTLIIEESLKNVLVTYLQ
ncbi:MAG: Abi family protein [Bacilli bacterium]|nr:Abi family protein [Bacilli bacterium]